MAFKIALNPSYTTTVKVNTPNDKDGFDTSEFKVKFKRVKLDELNALRQLTNLEAMKKVIVGFSELEGDDGKELDFNEVTLDALLNIPQALQALSEAFWVSLFKETNAKN